MVDFKDFNFEAEFIKSAGEALAYKNGNKTKARSVVREIPTPSYTADDIVRVRDKYNLSQRSLAKALNVSARTVESWEGGKNKPKGASIRLLYLIENDKSIIGKLISIVP